MITNKNLLYSVIADALNAYLRLDPASTFRLNHLQGKVITVECLPFHFVFQLLFKDKQVTLERGEKVKADAIIRGTPLQMFGVMMSKQKQKFFAEDLVIEGDAALGQEVSALFDELEIDWEEQLSRLIGDVPAHYFGRAGKGLSEWIKKADESLSRNIDDYMHEEAQFYPTASALQDFFEDIDHLRMAVDRIEAKINLLKKEITDDEEIQ